MAYRLEISPNNRATCVNLECKQQGERCVKGTLRHGTLVTINEHQTWKWRHWGCVTPVQIANMKQKTEDNLEYMDGYEELPEDLQEKVRQAMGEGHVDDEDWNGDVEMNRPGQKGFRSPATKKAGRAAAKAVKEAANDDEEKEGEDDGSPTKQASKKRGRSKRAEAGDESDAQEPPAKKTKATMKKGKKPKTEDDGDEAPDAEVVLAKKTKALAKSKKVKEEDDTEIPKKQRKAPAKKGRKAKDEDMNDGSGEEAPPPKKVRGRKAAAKANGGDPIAMDGAAEEEEGPADPAPKSRKSGRARKAA